jgi:hypothetical protein
MQLADVMCLRRIQPVHIRTADAHVIGAAPNVADILVARRHGDQLIRGPDVSRQAKLPIIRNLSIARCAKV